MSEGTPGAGEPPEAGGGTCPFCGASGSFPTDWDSWSCRSCGREYPTQAFKCRQPGCWDFVFMEDFCESHTRPHEQE
jgi:hypothetical protein